MRKDDVSLALDDKDIQEAMSTRMEQCWNVGNTWRQFELRENNAVFEGSAWTAETIARQNANSMPIIGINSTAPVIEAICGFEIQNRLDINYVPRLANAEQAGYSDIMNDAAAYIQQNAKAYIQYSQAFKNMLICGVGATDTTLTYDNNPDGEVKVEAIFPGFVFWDPNARAKNAIDADYVIRTKVLNRDTIMQQYGMEYSNDVYDSDLDARLLEYFNAVVAVESLSVIYEYQWRVKKPIYRVANPVFSLSPEIIQSPMAGQIEAVIQSMGEVYGFDPMNDPMFTIEKSKDLRDIKQFFSNLGVEVNSSKQHMYKYYRSLITNGKVITKSENFSQKGFSIKFMTGNFSDLTQMYYGVLRGCKDPQRMLNQAVSDYVGFLQTIPKGGVDVESDAVDDLEGFLNTYSKARQVSVYSPGGLAKSRPKPAAPMPQGLFEMIQYADSQIMKVCGVTPELMGMMTSKEMNTSFYKQQIKQGLTTLSTYFDAKESYMQNQAELYIDCVRIMAENAPGRLINNITGKQNEKYLPLTLSNIAGEYDVIVEETPYSPDENQDTFLKIIDMQSQLSAQGQQVNLMPLAMQYAPFPEAVKEQIMQAMQPPPPPEPDPINQEILLSEIRYKDAQSEKIRAEAQRIQLESLLKQSEVEFSADKQATDIEYTEAKTLSELSRAEKYNVDSLSSLFKN